jgi:hypothetical protein
MNARDVETAAAAVEKTGRSTVRALVMTGVVAGVALAVLPFQAGFAIALAVGAVSGLVAAAALWWHRRERIERLALEPAAYSIPEVARFGARVAALTERRRLASWIESVACEGGGSVDLHLALRASKYAHQLQTLARDLAAPSARVDPAMAVACRRLLTQPVESPLYNPNLPEEDLGALLLRIEAGISYGEVGGSS